MEIRCQIKSYIQPFERKLAILELKALSTSNLHPVDGSFEDANLFRLSGDANLVEKLSSNLAYWEELGETDLHRTDQIKREVSYLISRNGVSLNDLYKKSQELIDRKSSNKRCLRYATHGLHEYRGKFFPQLVRALTNVAEVPESGLVIDTMCGSGTTLVESVISGRKTFGLDMNPLSVFVSTVKCEALGFNSKKLINAFDNLTNALDKQYPQDLEKGHFNTLGDRDKKYLESWFGWSVLIELDHIVRAIQTLKGEKYKRFFTLCLSNIIRGVSWQKVADLRVRKEIINLPIGEVISRFVKEAKRSTKTVVAFSAQRSDSAKLGKFSIQHGDARKASTMLKNIKGKVDAIITSPPYATALPYLDTDRLSLIYLNLLTRPEHRKTDLKMIGNREISERQRCEYWTDFEKRKLELPPETVSLIEKIDLLNKSKPSGFRRRNLSALLAKYFFDMKDVMIEQKSLLKPDGLLFMVVGNNRTTAGGVHVEIETVNQIIAIGEAVGLSLEDDISMDILVSRDIFRANAQKSEHILKFKKQAQ